LALRQFIQDTDAAVYTLKLESGDFQTAVKVLDSNGKQISGQTDTQGNTTVFTFPSPGGKLTVVVRSGGN
jgi:hypothetical protein